MPKIQPGRNDSQNFGSVSLSHASAKGGILVIAILFWLCLGSIFYTYAGYPMLLTLLARTRPKPLAHKPISPTVTLLIAAYNEQAAIADKLENSLALSYPADRLQILVAADGSDDHTTDIVPAFAERGVELSYSPLRRGKMAAINRAIPQARGEILVFSDANNMYDSRRCANWSRLLPTPL